MVSDFQTDGPINRYLKKDQNTIDLMTAMYLLLNQTQSVVDGVKTYLKDIGIGIPAASSTATGSTTAPLSMRIINNKYSEYVTQAQQIYTDLQKLGKYEITVEGARNRKEIADILAKRKLGTDSKPMTSTQDQLNYMIKN